MAKLSIFGVLSTVQMILHTMCHGAPVGTDEYGNRYYTGKARKGTTRQRRWVMYAGTPEASMVPSGWHGWLHHQTDMLPADAGKYRKPWQKPHLANMTGSDNRYLPPGAQKDGHRDAATGDYTAWQPPA